jgi:pimeloyl-ACP methyl ester carboxylesterase
MDGTAYEIVSDEAGRIQSVDVASKGIKVRRLAPGTGPTTAPPATGGAVTTTPPATGDFPIEDPGPMMPNRGSYNERDARIFGAGTSVLSGTLTFPKEKVKHPAVVLISGAGPSDRNWNAPSLVSGSPAAQIADRLGASGYCAFRFDDRGVGKSTGRRSGASFWQTVSDARSLVAWVKGQPEVDPFRIVIAGHGEGALIAFILAVEDPTIAGVISIAGPSKPIDKVIMEQLNAMSYDENLPVQDRDKAARMIPKMTEIIGRAKAGELGIVEGINLEWLREHMTVNPLDYVARLRVPLLIVQGLDDNMTLSRNATEIKEAAEATQVDAAVEMIARMSHFLMQWPYGNPDYDAANPNLLVPKAHTVVLDWLNSKIKAQN